MTTEPLLVIRNLTVELAMAGTFRSILRGIDLEVAQGEAVGLVGESGSGKSMTARAIDRLLPAGSRVSGKILFDGADVLTLTGDELRRFRQDVAMIFQDPRAQVNPVRKIGDFMVEAVVAHDTMTRRQAEARAVELLDAVGITHAKDRLRQYPHEMSGGMLQRVMIASALMGSPRLVLADEPTTALDVTTQAGVMGIIDRLRREHGLALIFITHDLELAAAVCDRTAVMYAGQVVEVNRSREMDASPQHPYTAALVQARPRVDVTLERLGAIPGQPMSALAAPQSSCSFAERCWFAKDVCAAAPPPVVRLGSALSRCHRADEVRGALPVLPNG